MGFVPTVWIEHLRSEHIEIVVPVVMEMFKRVHDKFTHHHRLILPPTDGEMLVHPVQISLSKLRFLMKCLQNFANALLIN